MQRVDISGPLQFKKCFPKNVLFLLDIIKQATLADYFLICVYFIGTQCKLAFIFFLQMFGCGAVAQLVLSGGSHGMFLTVNFAFGFAATLGILVCGQVSGKQSLLLKDIVQLDINKSSVFNYVCMGTKNF